MSESTIARPRSAPLLIAAASALANGAWSMFLWRQLHVARAGGEPYCVGGGCASLWDGPFASAVHATTGIPVAGWGLVWSIAALALVLWVWNLARTQSTSASAVGGLAWLALAGALGVAVLVGVSARVGELCGSCAVTYALVGLFAACVFVALPDLGAHLWKRGVATAALAVGVGFGLLLYPGLQTPRAGSALGAEMLPAASESAGSTERAESQPAVPDPLAALKQLLDQLPPAELQNFANTRAGYLEAAPVKKRRTRAVIGARMAPVRLTTWTDSGCSHCAYFHDALERVLKVVPPSSIAIEQRVYPLDASCNEHVIGGGNEAVCLAARVRLCLEEDSRALDLSGWLHTQAQPLSTESIYRVASRLAPREQLEACVASRATQEKLSEDIAFAKEVGLLGTPFILVNSRPTNAYVPFLYALAVTQGNAEHPIFASLPPPAPEAGHEGHAH
jgi:serine/threonine-protein kinase